MALSKAIGQAIFKRLAPELMRPMEMIRYAKRFGGTYRKTDMLADIRTYTHRAKYQTLIEGLSGNEVVPKAWMTPTELAEPGANYRVFGKSDVLDLRTGIVDEQVFSFYHTELLKKDDYASDFIDYFGEDSAPQDMEILSFNQTILEHNIGKPY